MKRLLSFTITVVALGLLAAQRPAEADNPKANAENEALLQEDRDFDTATAERGVEGWVAYFADNGSMLPATGPPLTGPAAIRQAMAPVFADPSYSLRWQPTRADILIPGVLGLTTGRYQSRKKNPEGKTLLQRGTYVTLWRKQPDDTWKIVFDTGNPDGPPTVVD